MELSTQIILLKCIVVLLLGTLAYVAENSIFNPKLLVHHQPLRSNPMAGRSLVPWRTESDTTPEGTWGNTRVHIPDWVFQKKATASMRCYDGAEADTRFPMDQLRTGAHAQNKEDVWLIEHMLWGCTGGLILESGAYDGLAMSTTYLFVEQLEWRAVHIEAAPRTYNRLVPNRPDAVNIHTALCEKPRPLHWIERDSEFQGGVNGIFEFMAPSFLAEFYPGRAPGDATGLSQLSCRPITPWLQMIGIAHINVWVLDVEGAELDVLKAVDFDSITIDVIFCEADRRNPQKDRAVIELLQRKGYTYYAHELSSDWFYRSGFTPRRRPGVPAPPTPALP